MTAIEQRKARNRANMAIRKLTRDVYFASIPVSELQGILSSVGFNPSPLDGIYTGAQGTTCDKIDTHTTFAMQWYRMPSGRYEIVAYLS